MMKHCFILALFLAFFTNAQAQWQEIASYPGTNAEAPVSFTIGDKAYVGCGIASSEFWEYTPASDSWRQIAAIPGGPRGFAFGFSIDGIGYVGTGDPDGDTVNAKFDFWAYDPVTDTWTQKADYTFLPRAGTYSTVYDGIAYVGGGFNNLGLYGDLYSYNPKTDTWLGQADMPDYQWMSTSAYFTMNGKLYVGTGSEDIKSTGWGRWKRKESIQSDQFFEYDPATNKWTELAPFPGDLREGCVGFTAGGKGYIGGGIQGKFSTGTTFTDLWSYDRETNSWSSVAPTTLPDNFGMWCNAFTINNTVYLGLGTTLPTRQSTNKMFKYEFGSLLTSSLLANSLTMNSITQGSSADTTFTLVNDGSGPLSISQIAISGDASNVFTFQGPSLPVQLASGQSVQVTVTAAPANIGEFTAQMVVTSNAQNGSEFTIPFSVTGRLPAPIIEINRTGINFGNIGSGTSATESFTIHNDGEATLTVSELTIENDSKGSFSLPGVSTPLQIEPGNTEVIDVKYSPKTGGTFSAEVKIVSNAANGSEYIIILNGTAGSVSRTLEVLTANINLEGVEIGTYADGDIAIKNPGANTVTVTNISIDGDPDGLFVITSAPTPFILNSMETAHIGVRFTPTEEGIFNATMKITSNSDTEPNQFVPLKGVSFAPTASAILLDPTELYFDDTMGGDTKEMTFNIKSVGTLKLRVEDVAVEGAQAGSFALKGYTPPTTLLPGGSKKITVTFTPTSIGDHEARLAITSDAQGAETVYLNLFGYSPDPTGVEDLLPLPATAAIALYPNPVSAGQALNYHFEGPAPQNATVTVYNVYGKVVFQRTQYELQPGSHSFRLGTNLPSGMYLLTFYSGGRPTTVPLVVLQR